MNTRNKTVFVGLSGGVDSSVSALLLKEQGYNVVGVYMKNWSRDLPGMPCPWKDDYQDAKRIAVQLGIDFKMYDFEKQYQRKVVDYMLDEFQAGLTPNPDVMCNQEVKFKLFLNTALEDGADYVATGHYAKTKDGQLYVAKDDNKDQTYFLYRVTKEALEKTIFPLGDLTKPEVREIAKKHGLVTATKKRAWVFVLSVRWALRSFCSNTSRQNLAISSSNTGKKSASMMVPSSIPSVNGMA
jgi:tRNA-specific 2-thiouridylase